VAFDREGTLRKAEKLLRQGNLEAAIAEYHAVVEDQPSDLNTANALGDLYVRSRQTDKAVAEYARIAGHLAERGFLPKAAALYKKILKIKPDEEAALWALGSISATQGLMAEARANLQALIDRRVARGDRHGTAEVRVMLGDLDGADVEARLAGARARAELGDVQTGVERLKVYAADLHEKSRDIEALELLAEATSLDPADLELQRLLVQIYESRGDMAGARKLLAPESGDTNPQLLWALAEAELRGDRIAEGTALLQKLIDDDPSRRDTLILLGCTISATNPAAGYECIDMAARLAIAADDWVGAASALGEFVTRVPNHIPALMRLVEISVDGGLEATMHTAQEQLADAYLAAGSGAEALVIAEDLVAREPWEQTNIDRMRRALALLGDNDVDGTIAARLGGDSPFTTTDRMAPPAVEETAGEGAGSTPSEPVVDLSAVLDEPDSGRETSEVDLSEILHDLRRNLTATLTDAQAAPPLPIEQVLKNVWDEAVHDSSPESAGQQLTLAGTFVEMGLRDEAQKALEAAARSIHHRFRAAAALGKFHLDGGDVARAIEWYERAAEEPAPSAEAQHALLYELASVLESHGEGARALAVLLELRAEAGDYRDLPAKLEQLKIQMGS
jgi:tetratricopeptide (TPR) repeat protein